ncbi:MAG: acyl carrier protein [Pseudonocardiaceae bacterium]
MDKFTLDDLRQIMRSSAGLEEHLDLAGDIEDVEFTDLGYDSLAVLELANQVQRRYGVRIPDEEVAEMPTPGKAVELINKRLAEMTAMGA